jgi:hypothetical protein
MPDPQTGNRSAFAAVVAAIGSLLTVIADVAGIAQLQTMPALIVVAVLALGALVLGAQAIISRKGQGGLTVWLAGGAILCAVIAAIVMVLSTTRLEQSAAAQTETTRPSLPDSTAPTSTSSTANQPPATKPIVDTEVQLQLDTGVDIDQKTPNVVHAQAAAGKIDIALKYYGNLHATGKGFYRVSPADDPQTACRAVMGNDRNASTEVISVAGGGYCLRTSEGNLAWMQVVDSSTTAFTAPERAVTLAVKVWPK